MPRAWRPSELKMTALQLGKVFVHAKVMFVFSTAHEPMFSSTDMEGRTRCFEAMAMLSALRSTRDTQCDLNHTMCE